MIITSFVPLSALSFQSPITCSPKQKTWSKTPVPAVSKLLSLTLNLLPLFVEDFHSLTDNFKLKTYEIDKQERYNKDGQKNL